MSKKIVELTIKECIATQIALDAQIELGEFSQSQNFKCCAEESPTTEELKVHDELMECMKSAQEKLKAFISVEELNAFLS